MTDKTLEQRVIDAVTKKFNNYIGQSPLGSGKTDFVMPWKDYLELESIIQEYTVRLAIKEKALSNLEATQDSLRDTKDEICSTKDGWIPHTTGKQPVDDDVMVEVRFVIQEKDDNPITNAGYWVWDEGVITHYRIVRRKTYEEYVNSKYNWEPTLERQAISDYIEEILIPHLEKKDV